MGYRQTGAVIVIGLPSMRPRISFPAGLRASRVRFHGQHATHPCYAHLLKTSPVIQGWQTTHNQSDQPERSHSQRWGSPTTRPATQLSSSCVIVCSFLQRRLQEAPTADLNLSGVTSLLCETYSRYALILVYLFSNNHF